MLKRLYLKLKYGGAECSILTKLDTFINDELKPENVAQYKILKENSKDTHLVCDNDKITIKYASESSSKLILWEDLKSKFKENSKDVTVETMKGIGILRRLTLNYLLKTINYNKDCYIEMGSTDLTSDLDFTYVYLAETKINVVELLIIFYNKFYEMYQNFPDKTFDTNYYVTNTFVNKTCFSKMDDSFKHLFTEEFYDSIENNLDKESPAEYKIDQYQQLIGKKYNDVFRLYYKKNSEKYENVDRNICFMILKESLKTHDEKDKLANLIRTATIFYNSLPLLKDGPDNNKAILFLRILYYFMAKYSNESYISDATFNIIVLGEKMNNEKDNLLSFVDNYKFVEEWYHVYEHKHSDSLSLIGFFDMACKYIIRCHTSFQYKGCPFKISDDLYKCSEYWRKNIRGKISLSKIEIKKDVSELKITESKTTEKELIENANNIISYINTNYPKEKIHTYLTDLFKNISKKFTQTDLEEQLMKDVLTLINKVNVRVDNKIEITNSISDADLKSSIKNIFDKIKL